MKKRFLVVSTAVIMSASVLLPSCIGSFALSNKVLAWNKTVDNKYVNELIFIALNIVPVYPISMFADALVFNSIEFWSGENPLEAGIVKTIEGETGVYTVETLENGYSIRNEKGEAGEFVYNKADNSWSWVAEGETIKLLKYTDDAKNAIVYFPNGTEQKVELSANGVLAFRQIINNASFFAAK